MQEIIEEYLKEKYEFLTTKVEHIDIRKYKILVAIRVYDVPIEFEIIYVWDTHYTNYTNLETIRERIEKELCKRL